MSLWNYAWLVACQRDVLCWAGHSEENQSSGEEFIWRNHICSHCLNNKLSTKQRWKVLRTLRYLYSVRRYDLCLYLSGMSSLSIKTTWERSASMKLCAHLFMTWPIYIGNTAGQQTTTQFTIPCYIWWKYRKKFFRQMSVLNVNLLSTLFIC